MIEVLVNFVAHGIREFTKNLCTIKIVNNLTCKDRPFKGNYDYTIILEDRSVVTGKIKNFDRINNNVDALLYEVMKDYFANKIKE